MKTISRRVLAVLLMGVMLTISGPAEMAFAAESTQSSSSETTQTTAAPKKVTGLKTVAGKNSITIKWNKSDDADGYILQRSDKKDSGFKTIRTYKTNSTVKTKNKVKLNKTYYYRIYATNNGKKSAVSAVVSGKAVTTMGIKITFKQTRTLTSHDSDKVTRKFKKGKKLVATKYSRGRYGFYYKDNFYYVNRISVKNQKISRINKKLKYTTEEAENFVNDLGLSSKTKYLIWVNTYTQREYIFQGKKNHWKCIRQCKVGTGKATTPTATGAKYLGEKQVSKNNIKYWTFSGITYAFHGKKKNMKIGYPYSGGCVRHTNDNAKWIYYNCAAGTRVYVF